MKNDQTRSSDFVPRTSLNGWLVIDKPTRMTSHDVVNIARRKLGIRKIGHSGTLDPDATGVLVLAVGKATRLIQYLPPGKAYRADICLGITTDTQDASGKILEQKPVPSLSREELEHLLSLFIGELEQIPPMVSAVSYQGQRLYKLARQGIEVPDRPSRRITIERLDLQAVTPPVFSVMVHCSPGTYIRTLAHDMGQMLGCGAHLLSLKRTQSNGFQLKDTIELEQISHLLSLAYPFKHLPAIELQQSDTIKLLYGQKVTTKFSLPQNTPICVYNPEKNLIAIGSAESEHDLKPRIVLADPNI